MDRTVPGFILGDGFASRCCPDWFFALAFGAATALSVASVQAQQMCGGATYPFPFTDVSGVGAPFCPGIMEAYVTGVSKGTTPTTFSPNQSVPRLQMTTFLQRALDQGLARTNRRAALNQWWTPQNTAAMQTTFLVASPYYCATDGQDVWISENGFVSQLQANTGKQLALWNSATSSRGVLTAAGLMFVAGATSPGSLYVFDPTQPPGAVFVAANNLGDNPDGIAFDGTNIWTANTSGSVSIIAPPTYTVTTVTTGFTSLAGILYDGAHIWVTDPSAGKLFKLDSGGAILQTVSVGVAPQYPVFDGANIWVPNSNSNSITVVQASSGNVVATISADASNKLNNPTGASFDGERVLVTNFSGDGVTVFKAADLSFLANVSTGTSTGPYAACSDGIHFWVGLLLPLKVLRF
jgi:hypothetical protein